MVHYQSGPVGCWSDLFCGRLTEVSLVDYSLISSLTGNERNRHLNSAWHSNVGLNKNRLYTIKMYKGKNANYFLQITSPLNISVLQLFAHNCYLYNVINLK